ncbi:MAG: DUF3291 domain-containing protein [Anaerolineales bacterium]|nr:DUF3291 domain-containing protein [Anaerolineales bacterium]
MTQFHIAQLNIGRMLGPTNSPVVAEFMNALDRINALAEASPGFVWRLKDDTGNATSIRVYADERLAVNLSVWESVDALREYAYKSEHVAFVRRRHEWFETLTTPYMAMWWLPAGTLPTPQEAKARLEYLTEHGETPHAFSFKKLFEPQVINH